MVKEHLDYAILNVHENIHEIDKQPLQVNLDK